MSPSSRLVLLALLGSGCQVVFGLNEYEVSGGAGAGGAAAGGGAGPGAGGEGAVGAGPGSGAGEGGVGGSGGDSPWLPVEVMAAGLGTPPALCASGEPRINLFGGESGLSCTPCTADPDPSSCLATLTCFSNIGCSNNATVVSNSTSCVDIGLHAGCRASPATAPSCGPVSGGELIGDGALQSFVSLCPCDGCDTCLVAEGDFGADTCIQLERPHHYALRADSGVNGTCSSCSSDPVCSPGPAYRIGDVFGDCDTDVEPGECKVLGAVKAQRTVTTDCQAVGGVLTTEAAGPIWTLCCLEPLPDEFVP